MCWRDGRRANSRFLAALGMTVVCCGCGAAWCAPMKKQEELEVVVVGVGGRLGFEEAGGLAPGSGLPIVFAFFLRDPGWQRLIEVRSQRENVGLVHTAKFD